MTLPNINNVIVSPYLFPFLTLVARLSVKSINPFLELSFYGDSTPASLTSSELETNQFTVNCQLLKCFDWLVVKGIIL